MRALSPSPGSTVVRGWSAGRDKRMPCCLPRMWLAPVNQPLRRRAFVECESLMHAHWPSTTRTSCRLYRRRHNDCCGTTTRRCSSRQGSRSPSFAARLGRKNATETVHTYSHRWPSIEEQTRLALSRTFQNPDFSRTGDRCTPVTCGFASSDQNVWVPLPPGPTRARRSRKARCGWQSGLVQQ